MQNTAVKKLLSLSLLCLVSAVAGHFISVYVIKNNDQQSAAPMLYVGRCSFHYQGGSCAEHSKNVIYFASDEFLSFTDNWAVGRVGNYKMHMSCYGPDNENSVNGAPSSLTVTVAGPELIKAYEIAAQLITDFSAQLAEQGDSVSHCIGQ